jgi:hypothetical protein
VAPLDEAEDAEAPEAVAVDRIGDGERRRAGAGDEHRPVIEAAHPHVAGGDADADPLGEQEEDREDREEQHPEPADAVVAQELLVHPRGVEHEGEEHRAGGADADDRPRLIEERHGAVRAITAGEQQHRPPDDEGEGEERQVVGDRIEPGRERLGGDPRQDRITQPVAGQESGGDKDQIEDENCYRKDARAFFQHGWESWAKVPPRRNSVDSNV